MAIAITLEQYLSDRHIPFETLDHKMTRSALDSCATAHIPNYKLAKAVMLYNSRGELLMAVLPATNRLSILELNRHMGEDYKLMSESHLYSLFPDCEEGAVPSIGLAYSIPMVVDYTLFDNDEVYVEAGDHQHLLKLDRVEYMNMLSHVPQGDLCGAAIGSPKFVDSVVRDW